MLSFILSSISELCLSYWSIPYCSWTMFVFRATWLCRKNFFFDNAYSMGFIRIILLGGILVLHFCSISVLIGVYMYILAVIFLFRSYDQIDPGTNKERSSIEMQVCMTYLICLLFCLSCHVFPVTDKVYGGAGFILLALYSAFNLGIYPYKAYRQTSIKYEWSDIFVVFYTILMVFLILLGLKICVALVEGGLLWDILQDTWKLKNDSWDNFEQFSVKFPKEFTEFWDCIDTWGGSLILLCIHIFYLTINYLLYSLVSACLIWFVICLALLCKYLLWEGHTIFCYYIFEHPVMSTSFFWAYYWSIVFNVIIFLH